MTTIAVRISAIDEQGAGNRSLRLEPVSGDLPPFEAGAHIDVHLPNGLTRQYSLAGSPRERGHYLLCIKHEPQSRGGSSFVHQQLAAGAELLISAPRNAFPLLEAEHYLLLAAGIGITPLLSMAEELQARGTPFSLHYYTRSPAELAFAKRLSDGFAEGSVQLHHSITGCSPRQHVPETMLARRPGSRLYLCGPAAFMAAQRERAALAGWPQSHVHTEAFAPATEGVVGDAFEVTLAKSGTTVAVGPEQSIAAALLAAGVEVPLSCEMGMCGACLTGLLEGEGDHRDQVLSDAERASNQQIALCCSRSHSARLVLDM
ncbi:PDR/VanB family oxidoreductase [Pseudomonas sp. Marseille-P9899]|uniref:PDR/VanB family oxidoreductase n=1 Tax=Pseudomonas sp. Marseille-P9899 TaxID=2730401 RepID=UPI00158E25A2|nr:PDR/VanB family oxidoreductase [Pseudomonas sp. Marseille-P9899]